MTDVLAGVCDGGRELVNCSNSCNITCRQQAGVDDCVFDGCQSGCRCGAGWYLNDDGYCVESCPCYSDGVMIDIGSLYPTDQDCQTWYALCLKFTSNHWEFTRAHD